MKISHQKLIDSVVNKLTKYGANTKTINAFKREANKIVTNDYKVLNKLKDLNQSISKEKPTLKESKAKVNVDKVKHLQGFSAHQKSLAKVMTALGTLKKNTTALDLPISYKSNKVIEFKVNKKQTRAQIEKLGNKISKQFQKDGVDGVISIALRYDKGWRSGYFTPFGQNVELYDPDMYDDDHHHYVEDQNTYNKFVIYISERPKARVGYSDNNDCLYNCLKSVLYDNLPWTTPEALKKFLGINRLDKVDIYKHIPLIEKKLVNIAINITGDYIYTSPIKSNKIINIKCIDEHATVDNQRKYFSKLENFAVSYKERKPIIFEKSLKGFFAYDGVKTYELSKEERDKHYNFETDSMLIVKRDNDNTLEEEYKEFIHDAEILKKETKGYINLYKTGYKDKVTALDLFDRYTKHIMKAPIIYQAEANFINNASTGAIIFFDDYTGPAYKYDVVSMYPSIMNSKILFPIKEGEFLHITEFNKEFFKYGIYRAEIDEVQIAYNVNSRKLFRFNKKNYYTHFDLTRAKELGLEIKLIIDGQPNFLYYSRDKLITGTELFGNYVNQLFDLKQKKLPRAKNILNILWGALSQKSINKHNISNNLDRDYIIPDDTELIEIKPYDDNTTHIGITNNDKQFKLGFGRIKPFLISKGRSMISKITEPYVENLVRCHTDGFLLTEKPTDLKIGNNIGELKYEGYNDNYYKIKNSYNKNDFH